MFDHFSVFFINYLLHPVWLKIPSEHSMLMVIILFFSGVLLLETIAAYRIRSDKELIQSYRTNITTFLFNDVMMSVLSVSSLLLLADKHNHNGLISDFNPLAKTLISFIFLDLILYLWHKANHQYDSLWMFHKVHHSDRSMNVTTSFRVHFVDLILTTAIKASFIVVMGVEAAIVAFCESITTLFTMFHHSTLSMPGEKWLKWIFIVPSLHRTHHSVDRDQHDNNYGAILSLWDRIFGTLSELKPKEIGLRNTEAKNFYELIKFGFTTSTPASETAQKLPSFPNLDTMIAEAAYYKAEKRGFAPGCDLQDWLDAEKETMKLLV